MNTTRLDKLKEMLQSSPEDCFLLHAMGLELLKIKDTDQAIASFRKVLQVNPQYVGTYYHLGRALEDCGSREHAIDIYEQGIQVATVLKDLHARNELQMALDDLTDE